MTFQEFYNSIEDNERELIDLYKEILSNKKPKSILEIGSGYGLFTRAVMEFTDNNIVTIDKLRVLPAFDRNTEGFEQRIKRVLGSSEDILPQYKKGEFDFIFVDGSHTYHDVAYDLKKSFEILESGTLLIDDYFHKKNYRYFDGEPEYGIQKAVGEFCRENKLNGTTYFHANGYIKIEK